MEAVFIRDRSYWELLDYNTPAEDMCILGFSRIFDIPSSCSRIRVKLSRRKLDKESVKIVFDTEEWDTLLYALDGSTHDGWSPFWLDDLLVEYYGVDTPVWVTTYLE